MIGTIKISNGKTLKIDHLMIAPPKYLKSLPKKWNTNGLIINDNGTNKMAIPQESAKYIFLNALDKGLEFKVNYNPKYFSIGMVKKED